MFFIDFLFALVFALIIAGIFAAAFGSRGPWESFLLFFIVLLLFTWAGGVWVTPFGPVLFGGYWLPFLIVAIVVALLLAAAVPPEDRREDRLIETAEPVRPPEETATLATVGFFFWLFIFVLIVAIVIAYIV
jgi:hypothetical protein